MRRALILAAALLSVGLLYAQTGQPPTGGKATETTSSSSVTTHKVSTILQTSVSLQSESLGKVVDVVFNEDGCIEYLVISYQEEYLAIPWGAVRVDERQHTVVITHTQVTRENLRTLTFRKDSWPNTSDAAWAQKMRTVWGASASRREGGGKDRGGRPGADRSKPGKTDPASGTKKLEPPGKDKPGASGTKKEAPTKDKSGVGGIQPDKSKRGGSQGKVDKQKDPKQKEDGGLN